jgi:hypothetical protein
VKLGNKMTVISVSSFGEWRRKPGGHLQTVPLAPLEVVMAAERRDLTPAA